MKYLAKIIIKGKTYVVEVDDVKNKVYFQGKWYTLDDDGKVRIGFDKYVVYRVDL